MSKAIIFTGSEAPAEIPADLQIDGSFIIAADSGFDLAVRWGVNVDLLVGDFDSLSQGSAPPAGEILRFERDKDISDTEIAVREALAREVEGWELVGGGEGRLDHLLSIFALFGSYGPPSRWYTRLETLYLVQSESRFSNLAPGTTVGIIPAIPGGNSRVSTTGLHWDVSDFPIDAIHISLSNRVDDADATVRCAGDPVFFSIVSI